MADTVSQTLSDFNENNNLYQNTDQIVENFSGDLDAVAQSSLDIIGTATATIAQPISTLSKIAVLEGTKAVGKIGVERVNEVPDEDKIYAVASDIAYEHYNNNLDANKSQEKLDNYTSGYRLDPELSNEFGITLQTPDNKSILAYRGTAGISDIESDIAIATGRHRLPKDIIDRGNKIQENSLLPQRFSDAQALYEKVKATYGDVVLTGHSLGGSLADYIGRNNDEKAITFNQGDSIFGKAVENQKKSNTTAYITDSDLISLSSLGYKDTSKPVLVKQTEVNTDLDRFIKSASGGFYDPASHALSNFLPKDYLVSVPKVKKFIPFEPDLHRFKQSRFTNQSVMQTEKQMQNKPEIINNFCDIFKDDVVCGRRPKLRLRK